MSAPVVIHESSNLAFQVGAQKKPLNDVSLLDFRDHETWEALLCAMSASPACSDICIHSNGRVRMKVRREYCVPKLHECFSDESSWPALMRLIHPEYPEMKAGEFSREGGVSIGKHRFRVSLVRDYHGLEFTLRVLPEHIPSPASILLPDGLVRDFISMDDGLWVFAGSTGQGKTTSIAAMVGENARRIPVRVVTIEDPAEYLHKDQPNGSTFTFREIGPHSPTFATALRDAMRMHPDIIVVGEIRDAQAAEAAVEAALSGHKVATTVHGTDCASAVQRLAELVSGLGTSGVGALAACLRVVVAQRLLPSSINGPLVPIHEIMTANEAVATKIRTQKFFSLNQEIEGGAGQGMKTFKQSVQARILENKLPPSMAY